MRKLFHAKRSRMQGAVAVEMALLLIPMMLLAFGVVEYGRAIYQYNTLAKAVRDGVRILAQNNPADESYASIQTQVRCLVMHGNPTCSGALLVPELKSEHVVICDRVHLAGCDGTYENVATGLGVINLVELKITGYQFNYIGLPFVTDAASVVFGDIRATMRQIV